MTQFEHTMLATFIAALLFHLWIKQAFYSEKSALEIEEFFKGK